MTTSELAQEAARHLRELAVRLGGRSEELLGTIAREYEIDANVVHAWLLREFESLEALDHWAAIRREEIRRAPELERQRIANLREELDAEWKAIEADVAQWLREMRQTDQKKNASN